MEADALVLGAGIVGVSVAIHLAQRGRRVVLVDRREPGEETSFGNAGLIQREGVVPYGFPQDIRVLLRHAVNRNIDSSYHLSALPFIAGFLVRYWWHSRPASHRRIQRLYAPLIERSVDEHALLIGKARAEHLIRKDGWLKVFRTAEAFDAAAADADRLCAEFGLEHQKLTADEFARAEPHFRVRMAGALRWTQAWSISDPNALVRAYCGYFQGLGGRFVQADATALSQGGRGRGWKLPTDEGLLEAAQVVLALGPWGDTVARPLGYRLPVIAKRGYHMHYRPLAGTWINTPVFDAEAGFMLAPMVAGIRLTTGAEFALRDAPPTPVQLERLEQAARQAAPLGERLDSRPWKGARPCTPDMMPLIGPAPRHPGLWFALGHGHHGMTLGPITSRLLAEQMVGERPVIDPTPYFPSRFRI
jgi:D-amino-acid dehydrogenase